MKWIAVAALAGLLGTLAYLHDPPWLVRQTVGLRPPQVGPDGVRFQWSGMHAAFYLPADAGVVRLPLATTFDDRGRDPMMVTVWIDDVKTARALLTDAAWHDVVLRIPRPRWRGFVRVDVRTSVVREDNHGVKIGELNCCPVGPGGTR